MWLTVYFGTVCRTYSFRWKYLENIYSKLQHRSDIYHFTANWPCSKVTVSLWAEHFPFVAYVTWMTTGLYCRSIHKSQYDKYPVHTAFVRTEHCYDSSLVVFLQHSVVLCWVVLCCVVLCCVVLCCVLTEWYNNKLVTNA